MKATQATEDCRVPGGAKRRSAKPVLFSIAAALLLLGAAVLAPRADAADDGNDVDWEFTNGAGAYHTMINNVRQRATGGAVAREGTLRTNPNATGNFTVNVGSRTGVAGDIQVPRARLIIRERDLFVLGFVNGDPDDTERVFFFRGDDNGYRGTTGEAEVVNLPFNGSYTELEQNGRSRVGTTLNGPAWETAVRTLENATAASTLRDLAGPLTTFIMAVSEGARFDPIQTAFAPSFNSNNGGEHTVTAAEADLMNSWSEASQQLFDALDDGTPVNFQINDPATPGVDFEATTVSALTIILGIALVIVSL